MIPARRKVVDGLCGENRSVSGERGGEWVTRLTITRRSNALQASSVVAEGSLNRWHIEREIEDRGVESARKAEGEKVGQDKLVPLLDAARWRPLEP